jgi:hypothetical protein
VADKEEGQNRGRREGSPSFEDARGEVVPSLGLARGEVTPSMGLVRGEVIPNFDLVTGALVGWRDRLAFDRYTDGGVIGTEERECVVQTVG